MKKNFEEPSFEVVRFNYNVITASGCACDVAGYDFGEGANECQGGPGTKNLPECICATVDPVNCY